MKKKLTSLLLVGLTAIFVILGIVVPYSIEKNHLTYDYDRNLVGFDYKYDITITAGKQYEINNVRICFENPFGADLELVVNGDKITEIQDGKYYIYKFQVLVEDEMVDGMISGIDDMDLITSKGEKEVEYDFTNSRTSGLPIRIICFILAGITLIVGVSVLFINKHTSSAEEAGADGEESFESPLGSVLANIGKAFENLGIDEASKKTFVSCEYCGTENSSENTKCESCGAKISRK